MATALHFINFLFQYKFIRVCILYIYTHLLTIMNWPVAAKLAKPFMDKPRK